MFKTIKTTIFLFSFFFFLLPVYANASPSETLSNKKPNNNDPLESFNRHAYQMNDTLDKAILKPIAESYVWIMPKVGQKGVHNFFSNLRLVPSFLNDVLQADFMQAASDGWRFVINSTVGIAGFLDPAAHMDLPLHATDLGLTLAKWGYTDSTYLVIPFWGPSTIRDGVALIPYYYMTVYPYIPSPEYRYGLLAFDVIDQRAQLLDLDEIAKQAALDPYAFQRNAYLQHRNAIINKNAGIDNENTDEFANDLDGFADDDVLDDQTNEKEQTNKKSK